MEYERFNWNSIIRGAWNRAILTPSWISTNLFGLPVGAAIEVYVPINMLGPSRVKHEDLIVAVGEGFLEVTTDTPNFDVFSRVKRLGIEVLNKLPVTPVTAAGFNLRYKLKDLSVEIADLFNSELDHSLATANYSFKNRQILKGCISSDTVLKEGTINVSIIAEEDEQRIEFNFHRDSNNREELIKWLETPIDKIESEVDKFMTILGI